MKVNRVIKILIALFVLGIFIDTFIDVYKAKITSLQNDAENGDADAQLYLGLCYSSGDKENNIEQSDEKAVEWWEKSAKQGNNQAMFLLGGSYSQGKGVKQSDEKAVEWWRKSAEQGNTDVLYHIGVSYYIGKGVERSNEEAIYWLRKSCESGDDKGCELLNTIKKQEK